MKELQEMQVGSLGREDPLEKAWQPTPVFLPEESYGLRSLVGYSPCGHEESDTTERLSTCTLSTSHMSRLNIYCLEF